MEESQFLIPNLTEGDSAQRIEQYIRNLQGVFSVQIDTLKEIVFVRHARKIKRRDLVRTLSRLGFPEKIGEA